MFLSNSCTNISRDCSSMSAVKVDCGCKFTITQTVYPSGCKLENVNSPFVSPNSSVSSVNLAAHQDSTFPFATAISI